MATVTAQLIVVSDKDGKHHYLRYGAEVPDFVSRDDVKLLTDRGLVEEARKAPAKQADNK